MSTVDYDGPFELAAELLRGRRTFCILRALLHGPLRYGELRKGLRISDAVLLARLLELEENRLVERRVDASPVAVSYALTEAGRSLWPVIAALDEWAAEHALAGTSRAPGSAAPTTTSSARRRQLFAGASNHQVAVFDRAHV